MPRCGRRTPDPAARGAFLHSECIANRVFGGPRSGNRYLGRGRDGIGVSWGLAGRDKHMGTYQANRPSFFVNLTSFSMRADRLASRQNRLRLSAECCCSFLDRDPPQDRASDAAAAAAADDDDDERRS